MVLEKSEDTLDLNSLGLGQQEGCPQTHDDTHTYRETDELQCIDRYECVTQEIARVCARVCDASKSAEQW